MKQMFKVTGVDVYGKRFRIETDNGMYAWGINLHKGSVWLKVNDKWRLIKRVY